MPAGMSCRAVCQGVLTVHLREPPGSVVHSPSGPSARAAVQFCSQLFCSPSKGWLCTAVSGSVQSCCCSQKCPMAPHCHHPTGCNARRDQAVPPVPPSKYSGCVQQMTGTRGCLLLPGCWLPAGNTQQIVPSGSCLSFVGSLLYCDPK